MPKNGLNKGKNKKSLKKAIFDKLLIWWRRGEGILLRNLPRSSTLRLHSSRIGTKNDPPGHFLNVPHPLRIRLPSQIKNCYILSFRIHSSLSHIWWRRGESNPCPKITWSDLLRVQYVARFNSCECSTQNSHERSPYTEYGRSIPRSVACII